MLALTRPLVCLDVESTGTNVATDRVLELGLVHLHPDGTRATTRLLFNPERPIPPESTTVHGITDTDVAGQPTFAKLAEAIALLLTDVDLCGFNLRKFDLPLLQREFLLAGVPGPADGAAVIDAYVIFREREPRDLPSAVRLYCGREHEDAHSAVADADATLDVLLGQLARYPDLPRDLVALDTASGGRRPEWATEAGHLRWSDEGHLMVAFGKHAGRRLIDMDDGFLRWVLRNDFPRDVHQACDAVLGGIEPRAPGFEPPPKARLASPTYSGASAHDDDIPF